jgi:DNA primase
LNWKEHHDATGFTIPPKYYTLPHFPKGNFVYNLDRSRDFDCGIVMEGPTDVFSLGDGGVCSLGSSLTGHQIRLLTGAYRKPDRPIILVYDPEAFEEKHVQDLLYNEELLAHPGGFAPVILPAGTDPGSTPRKVLRNYIKEEAAKHGLKFDFRRIR